MSHLTAGVLSSPHGDIPVLEKGTGGQAAVIVLHQAGGISPQTEDTVEALADQGFWTLAPDLFHRKIGEEIPFPTSPGDFLTFDRWLSGDTDLRADIGAVLDHVNAAGIPAERIGIVGFSYGGRAAFLAATEWKLGAVVSYYANGVQRRSYLGNEDLQPLSGKTLRSPWLGLYGDADFFIAEGELDELERALEGAGVEAHLVRYPGAVHGFDVDGPRAPQPFDSGPGDDARRRTSDFLRTHLLVNQ